MTTQVDQSVRIYFESNRHLDVFCSGYLNKEEGWADVSLQLIPEGPDCWPLFNTQVHTYVEQFLLGNNPLPIVI